MITTHIEDTTSWTVVLIEDDEDNVEMARQVLEFRGATDIHVANNGLEGLSLLKTVKPTFILLDLSMPRMDGWELYSRLRTDPATCHIPIIAVTAHALKSDKDRALSLGFNGYIVKPYSVTTFVEDIKSTLRQHTLETEQ